LWDFFRKENNNLSYNIFDYLIAAIYAIVPVLIIIYYLLKRTRFDQPVRVVVITFFLGFGVAFPLQALNAFIDPLGELFHVTVNGKNFYESFLRAGLQEEAFKFLIIVYYCMHLREFRKPMDAIVFGVSASLGFAMIENWGYVINAFIGDGFSAAKQVALIRALTAILLHMICGIMMGFYLIDYIFEEGKKSYLILSLLFPVCLHGFYNFILKSNYMSEYWAIVLVAAFLIRINFIFEKQKKLEIENNNKTLVKTWPSHSDVIMTLFFSFSLLLIIYIVLNSK
jgi:RsiW-degrading membrane proteinase PrsW (M82 family)